ncbi:MAG: energy transducer TonB [Bacteroidales bacterium]|nr:energy transducer TonB [Bacteroidales bacterium]
MKKLSGEDKAGIYITVIFHLTVIIILLLAQLGATLKRENTFVLDFTKQEEVEKIKKEEEFKENISKRIDDLIAAASNGSVPVRNVAVDRNSTLKDDRNTDADQLYKDAERLQQELNNGFKVDDKDNFAEPSTKPQKKEEPKVEKSYSGPSVVSYNLEGRKASKLSIPAYRCLGGGLVTVIITVNPQGNVIDAKVQDDVSSNDSCLRNFAIRAARGSKFSVSPSAPAKQMGDIVYQFIAQ